MKIVINAFSARLGGGQTYLRNLLTHLPDDANLEVLVFAPDSLQLPEHARIRRIFTAWPTTHPLLRTLWEKWVLPRFLRTQKADVLFCPGGVVATRAPQGCRVVTMFRNMIPFDARAMQSVPWGVQRLRSLTLRRVMLSSMREAHLTIFIADFARQVIEALAPIPRSLTIPHGISAAFRASSPRPPPASFGTEPYMLYVSKFDTYKHHAEVVQAYALLPEALRSRVRLILVGEIDHPNAQWVHELVEKSKLSDRIVIHGAAHHADLPAMYQNATLNIFASSCENCPNILLEALAAGRPVISSNVMPMPEFGGTGIGYFSPFEPTSIASAMREVLENSEVAARNASAALTQSRLYDWAVTASKTWQALCAPPASSPERSH